MKENKSYYCLNRILAKQYQMLQASIMMTRGSFLQKIHGYLEETFLAWNTKSITVISKPKAKKLMFHLQLNVFYLLSCKEATLTVGQLMAFNTKIRIRNDSVSMYHSKKREPPVAIYLAHK